MNRSLSIAVIQIFTVNTLMGTTGFSQPMKYTNLLLPTRQIAAESDPNYFLQANEILSVSTNNGYLTVFTNDGKTLNIYQSYVDPKKERFDFSKGVVNSSGKFQVKDKDGKTVSFDDVRIAFNQVMKRNDEAAKKIATEVLELNSSLGEKPKTISVNPGLMSAFEYNIGNQTYYRMIIGTNGEIDFPEKSRQDIIAGLKDKGVSKYNGADENQKEIARIFGGYSFNDAIDIIREGGYPVFYGAVATQMEIPGSNQIAGKQAIVAAKTSRFKNWLGRFKKKSPSAPPDTQPSAEGAPEIKIQSLVKDNTKMVQVTIGTKVLEFSEQNLSVALDELKKNQAPQLPKEVLAGAPAHVQQIFKLFNNFEPGYVFEALDKNDS